MIRVGLGLLAMPGIVCHELAHLLFCKLVGARVHKVVLFQFGHPAGYVLHTAPVRFVDHLAIVVGPFVINSAVAFVLFWAASSTWDSLPPNVLDNVVTPLVSLIALWAGTSVSLQAFPSRGDARSLWQMANAHVRRGNILAATGYPVVAVIYAANMLRSAHVDFAYALLLLVVAAFA